MRRFPGPSALLLALVPGTLAACADDAPTGGRPAPPLNALLVTLDTTRADALGCYGRVPAVTPHLDALAAEGVLYERAYTTAPLTLPSHASMLTGLYPVRHSLRENGLWPLPAAADTLAELARARGVQTGAFVAAVVLDPTFGLAQGFDTYDAPERPERSTSSHYTERSGVEIVERALAWVAELDRDRPFFLWVHFFEPHQPYEPPPEFATGPLADDPYLGEVAAMDAYVGRLLEGLERLGELDETVVCAVGDHGEALGEHGEPSHAVFCYEPTLRVPLILRFPGGWRAGERSRAITSVVDVYPTLARALGVGALPAGIDGVDLWSEPAEDRGVYFESYSGYLSFGMSPLAGWLDREAKYLHSSAPELYDPAADPAETIDLAEERAEVLDRYRRAIAALLARPALEPDDAPAIDDALVKDIQGLGYTAGPGVEATLPPPLAPSDLPSPAEETENYADTLLGLAHLNEGQLDRAQEILAGVVARNPKSYVAREKLANCLMRRERFAEALPHLQRLVQERPMFAGAHFNLAGCLRETGQTEAAVAAYWRAVELDPQFLFMDTLMRYLRDLGRPPAEANAYVERYEALRAARLGQEPPR